MAFTAAGIGTALSVVTGVIGTVVSMSAAKAEGEARLAEAKYQRSVLQAQDEQLRLNAAAERERGAVSAQDKDFENLAIMEEEIAQQGASGFTLSSGSFGRKRRQNKILSTQDRLRITQDSEQRALDTEAKAKGIASEADFNLMRQGHIKSATKRNVTSTLITGASRVGSALFG